MRLLPASQTPGAAICGHTNYPSLPNAGPSYEHGICSLVSDAIKRYTVILPADAHTCHLLLKIIIYLLPEFSSLLNQEVQRQERSASWLAQRLNVYPSTVALAETRHAPAAQLQCRRSLTPWASRHADRSCLLPTASPAAPPWASGKVWRAPSPAPESHVRVPALPRPATPLVGRVAEIELIGAWLADAGMPLVMMPPSREPRGHHQRHGHPDPPTLDLRLDFIGLHLLQIGLLRLHQVFMDAPTLLARPLPPVLDGPFSKPNAYTIACTGQPMPPPRLSVMAPPSQMSAKRC